MTLPHGCMRIKESEAILRPVVPVSIHGSLMVFRSLTNGKCAHTCYSLKVISEKIRPKKSGSKGKMLSAAILHYLLNVRVLSGSFITVIKLDCFVLDAVLFR